MNGLAGPNEVRIFFSFFMFYFLVLIHNLNSNFKLGFLFQIKCITTQNQQKNVQEKGRFMFIS
jgi:hypothetical protein